MDLEIEVREGNLIIKSRKIKNQYLVMGNFVLIITYPKLQNWDSK